MVPHINEPVASFYTTVVESMKVHRANIENFLDEHSEPILVIEDLSQLQIILLAYYYNLCSQKFTFMLSPTCKV